MGGPHGEMEWLQVPGPTDPQKVPTLGLGWSGALWGVSDAQSPGSLQPPHPSLFPLAPGRCCWDLSGLCEWRLRVAGELRVLAGVTGRQKPRGQAQTLGASLELPRSLSLPDVATSPLPAPPGPVGPGPRCLGVSPTSLPPHAPPATLRFLRGGKGVSLELNLGGREGVRSGADISEIQCIQKRHECLILFY